MKFLKLLIIIVGIFISCSAEATLDRDNIFDDANKFYLNDDIDKAIELYESLIFQGEKSAAIFYNLGNSYLKKGFIGKAILNYERAKIVIPRDSALNFNLEYTRGKMKQEDISYKTNLFEESLLRNARSLSFNENVVFILILLFFIFILILFGLYFNSLRMLSNIMAFIFLVVIVFALVPARYKYFNNNFGAIIVDELIDARYEPDEASNIHFPLYEGNKVFFLRKAGEWIKVKRPDGKIGWIKSKAAISLKI